MAWTNKLECLNLFLTCSQPSLIFVGEACNGAIIAGVTIAPDKL
jgi:hypothetical protein